MEGTVAEQFRAMDKELSSLFGEIFLACDFNVQALVDDILARAAAIEAIEREQQSSVH